MIASHRRGMTFEIDSGDPAYHAHALPNVHLSGRSETRSFPKGAIPLLKGQQMLKFTAALAAFVIVTTPVYAAPCRDAKGHFIKCATPKKPVRCKDAKGKFAKCSLPGTHKI